MHRFQGTVEMFLPIIILIALVMLPMAFVEMLGI